MAAEFRTVAVPHHARYGVVGDPAEASEAWLILHGYGMMARGILHWFRAAAAPHRLLVAPEAPSRFYTVMSEGKRVVGASWTTRELLAEEVDDQFAYIEQVLHEAVPPRLALHVHGFSQGVSVGTRWAMRTARPVRRLVGWAGIIPDDVTGTELRRALAPEPLRLMVGAQDARVTPTEVEANAARLRAQGLEVIVRHFHGGHRVDLGALPEE